MSSPGMEIKTNKRSSDAEPEGQKPKKVKPASTTEVVASSSNSSDGADGRAKQVDAFPFMRLPTELQSMILNMAIHNAKKRQERELGDVLCVCQRFHELAVPHLFHTIAWSGYWCTRMLPELLRARPALARYLRNLSMIKSALACRRFGWFIELVGAIRAAFRTLPSISHRLDKLALFCPKGMYREVLDVCRLFEADHLALKATTYDRSELGSQTNFATLIDKTSLSEGALMQLTILHLDGFEIDMATADVLSRLPSLTKLIVTLCDADNLLSKMPEVIRVLLCTGETKGKLRTLLIHAECFEDRLRFQRDIGVCVPTVPIKVITRRREYSRKASSATVVSQGCQDLFKRREDGQRLFLSSSSCPRCPQCCAHTRKTDRSQRLLPVAKAIKSQKERSSQHDSRSTSGAYPYNLCQKHHAETYLTHKDSDSAFLHRRALECLRWIPFVHTWREQDQSCLVEQCY